MSIVLLTSNNTSNSPKVIEGIEESSSYVPSLYGLNTMKVSLRGRTI